MGYKSSACAKFFPFYQITEMADEQQQFEALINKLLTPDNDIRNEAEVRQFAYFCDACMFNANGSRY